jgi:hypothetical protein
MANRGSWLALLIAISALALGACANSTGSTGLAANSPADLPSPGSLPKLASEQGPYQNGADYTAAFPNIGVAAADTYLDFDAANAPHGMAFAMYAFDLTGSSGAARLKLHWDTDSPPVWLGLASWNANRWDWNNAGGSAVNIDAIEQYMSADGSLVAVVLTMDKSAVSTLRVIEFEDIAQAGQPPQIISVGPQLSGNGGDLLTLTPQLAGGPAEAYFWEFNDAAVPSVSSEAVPSIVLATQGSHSCSLDVSNADGEAHYEFTLVVSDPAGWTHTIGGADLDDFRTLYIDGSGNIVAAGNSGSEIAMASYTAAGDLLWRNTYHCAKTYGIVEYVAHSPLSLCGDDEGNIYMLTSSLADGSPDNSGFVLKFNSAGTTVWGNHLGIGSPEARGMVRVASQLKVLRGSSLLTASLDGERVQEYLYSKDGGIFTPLCICNAPYGGTYIAGYTDGEMGLGIGALSLDSSDNVNWFHGWDDELIFGDEIATACAVSGAGALLLAGPVHYAAEPASFFMEVASNGTVTYASRSTDPYCPRGIAQDASGNIAVISGEDPWVAGPAGLSFTWADSAGQMLSLTWLSDTTSSAGYSVLPLLSGSVIAAGAAPNASVQLQQTAGTTQPMSLKIYGADVPRTDTDDGWVDDEMTLTEQSYVEDTGGGGRDGLLLRINPLS